jgi:hypothetical protein
MEIARDVVKTLISIVTVINLILFTYSWVTNKSSKFIQLLTLYITLLFVTHFIMVYTSSNGIHNLYISHYYFSLQFIFLSLFYRELFLPKQKKWVTLTMVVVLTIFLGYYLMNPHKYSEFNLIDIFITNVPIIFYSVVHLYNMLSAPRRFFIINAGVLMYFSTNTLIFFLGTYLMVEGETMGFTDETVLNIWGINNILYLIYLVFLTIEWKKTMAKW